MFFYIVGETITIFFNLQSFESIFNLYFKFFKLEIIGFQFSTKDFDP